MKNYLKQKIKNDFGAVTIVEAAIVFPVVFFVLIFLIYMGNLYYQRSKIESIVEKYAYMGAAHCADPVLNNTIKNDKVPKKNDDIQPYKYFGGMDNIEEAIDQKVVNELKGVGFFLGMAPNVTSHNVYYNRNIIYPTFTVEVEYTITLPVRYFGERKINVLKLKSRDEVPIDDTGEFIRTADMAIDYMQQSEFVSKGINKISDAMESVKEFFSFGD